MALHRLRYESATTAGDYDNWFSSSPSTMSQQTPRVKICRMAEPSMVPDSDPRLDRHKNVIGMVLTIETFYPR